MLKYPCKQRASICNCNFSRPKACCITFHECGTYASDTGHVLKYAVKNVLRTGLKFGGSGPKAKVQSQKGRNPRPAHMEWTVNTKTDHKKLYARLHTFNRHKLLNYHMCDVNYKNCVVCDFKPYDHKSLGPKSQTRIQHILSHQSHLHLLSAKHTLAVSLDLNCTRQPIVCKTYFHAPCSLHKHMRTDLWTPQVWQKLWGVCLWLLCETTCASTYKKRLTRWPSVALFVAMIPAGMIVTKSTTASLRVQRSNEPSDHSRRQHALCNFKNTKQMKPCRHTQFANVDQ